MVFHFSCTENPVQKITPNCAKMQQMHNDETQNAANDKNSHIHNDVQ